MHASIAADLIIEKAEKEGKVRGISINLGELAPVTDEELRLAISGKRPSWKVEIKLEESKVRCPCGFSGRPKTKGRDEEFVDFLCPKCEKIPKVVSGEEIALVRVDLE